MIFVESNSDGIVDIAFDQEGLEDLKRILAQLETKPDHTHRFTPAWAGYELTEDEPSLGYFLVHKLTLRHVETPSKLNES